MLTFIISTHAGNFIKTALRRLTLSCLLSISWIHIKMNNLFKSYIDKLGISDPKIIQLAEENFRLCELELDYKHNGSLVSNRNTAFIICLDLASRTFGEQIEQVFHKLLRKIYWDTQGCQNRNISKPTACYIEFSTETAIPKLFLINSSLFMVILMLKIVLMRFLKSFLFLF